MIRITVAEELQHLTQNQQEVSVKEGTVKACIQELFCKFPQLYIFLVDNQGIESQRIMLILNDEELLEYSDTNKSLTNEDTLHIYYGVPFGESEALAPLTIWLAQYMSVAAAVAIVDTVAMLAVSMIVQYALSAIMGALVDDIANPESTIAGSSATYTFDGVKNTTASGTPVGIIYGRHRAGGQILSLRTENITVASTTAGTNNSPYANQNFIYYLIGLSEGEVQAVPEQGLEINKLPRSYFSAVNYYFNPGTRDQEALPEFSKVENTTSLNRKVLWVSQTWATPQSSNGSTTVVYGAVDTDKKLKLGGYVWVYL